MQYFNASQYAAKLGVSTRRIQALLIGGRIKGAFRLGDGRTCAWAIPATAPDPRKPAGKPPCRKRRKKKKATSISKKRGTLQT